ncbi:uncharacterized protein IL334_005726 [Kwoniella shivajii]|uniref:Uncharacterized protein n=1 Tax=Kwoniella shivajii TaxID=564305 RepID=A0ABZ1D4I2_9TREE|nr:hypothetical protein IL334_005726 [Kwoniella shivajii]
MRFSCSITALSAALTIMPSVFASKGTVSIQIPQDTLWHPDGDNAPHAEPIKFEFTDGGKKDFGWGKLQGDGEYVWTLKCHVETPKEFNEDVTFTLRSQTAAGFEGSRDTPAHLWCDSGSCKLDKCEGPNVIPVVNSKG